MTRNLLLLLVIALAPLSAWSEGLAVKVKQASIKEDHAFHARTLSVARFTENLDQLDRYNDWHKVRYRGKVGWVHGSAVAERDEQESGGVASGIGSALNLLAGKSESQSKGKFSEDEVALAGKGFNAEVEAEYRANNRGTNFAAVDQLEHQGASDQAIDRFAMVGGLTPRYSQPTRTKPASSAKSEKKSSSGGLDALFDKAGDLFKRDGDAPNDHDTSNPLDL